MLYLLNVNTTLAQQEQYTAYLKQAFAAVEAKDEQDLVINMRYFSVAIERDRITPEILSRHNLELYTTILHRALLYELTLPADLTGQVLDFLHYQVDSYPNNMFSLGYLYDHGIGVQTDHEKALDWYRKAAERGNASAMQNIGNMYATGTGIPHDTNNALYWYRKAAMLGNADAMVGIADIYYEGNEVEQDYVLAKNMYQQAAEKGHAYAKMKVGFLHAQGLGVEKNDEKAAEWFRSTDSDALFHYIGISYARGTELAQDYTKAAYWYREAAERNNPDAIYSLAELYREGKGVPQNYKDAIYWYKKIAETNFFAMFRLASCYQHGLGADQDIQIAKQWYKKACDKGFQPACNELNKIAD